MPVNLTPIHKAQPSIKLKIKDNTVMDSESTAIAEPVETAHFNLVIKKSSDSLSSVVVKQPQHPPAKPSIPRLKITNKSSGSFSLHNFFPGKASEPKKMMMSGKQAAHIQPVVFEGDATNDERLDGGEGIKFKTG